nr:DNA replication and repair protein RecF [Candidatus Krumholzibacteriota bacterium]
LEAIHFFKFGRSFRTNRDTELVQFGAPFCRAEVECVFDAGDHDTFTVSIDSNGEKRIKVSGKEVSRLSDLVGKYPSVLFGPDDIMIVSGEPAGRRRFLDSVGSMTDPSHIHAAREYRRILQQRNAALKARATDEELNAWNEQIVTAGAGLIEKRRDLARVLEREVKEHVKQMETAGEFSLEYDSALMREAGAMAAGAQDGASVPTLADVFAVELGARESEERRRMTTLVGPHRDDVSLRLDGKDLRRFGSQGQRRLFALLLKLAELSHLERTLGERCVLLLDDVFSEFDHEITGKLQHILDGSRQLFVTSPIELEWARTDSEARIHHICAGKVRAD